MGVQVGGNFIIHIVKTWNKHHFHQQLACFSTSEHVCLFNVVSVDIVQHRQRVFDDCIYDHCRTLGICEIRPTDGTAPFGGARVRWKTECRVECMAGLPSSGGVFGGQSEHELGLPPVAGLSFATLVIVLVVVATAAATDICFTGGHGDGRRSNNGFGVGWYAVVSIARTVAPTTVVDIS